MGRVVVGMSGGVDSSVAAYLLKEQGYDVVGVTMQIWQKEDACSIEENGGCCGLSAVEDARRVAAALKIPYYVMNFRQEFQKSVIDYFTDEYLNGRTPNPCIACNRYVKWEALLNRSLSIGADYIATGHYARIEQLPNGRYALRRSAALAKDQTYALYNLTQEQLKRTLMPVGAYSKDEIRAIAERKGLLVADKPDSQDICFVPDGDYAHVMEAYTGKRYPTGVFQTKSGEVLGRHRGIIHYTVGQRRGIGISAQRPLYVCQIQAESNTVILGNREDLDSGSAMISNVHWISGQIPQAPFRCRAKIRSRQQEQPATVYPQGPHDARIVFDHPQRAVTPGQAAVLYEGDVVLGGGEIQRAGDT